MSCIILVSVITCPRLEKSDVKTSKAKESVEYDVVGLRPDNAAFECVATATIAEGIFRSPVSSRHFCIGTSEQCCTYSGVSFPSLVMKVEPLGMSSSDCYSNMLQEALSKG